jgi:hypothetical protein
MVNREYLALSSVWVPTFVGMTVYKARVFPALSTALCFSASSIISNHIAFNTANAAAKGNPNSQAKYHMVKLLKQYI